jgi:hypothetical protein
MPLICPRSTELVRVLPDTLPKTDLSTLRSAPGVLVTAWIDPDIGRLDAKSMPGVELAARMLPDICLKIPESISVV